MKNIIDKYGEQGCFFIAEIGNNHSGSLKTAKEMVTAAKHAGASAVKFQKRNNKNLMQTAIADKEYIGRNSFGKTYLEHREKVELQIEEFKELKLFCEKSQILFFATPFDEESLIDLENINCELYKIASADIVHNELLKLVCQTKKPIILSTGGATMEEICNAVELIQSFGNPLGLLQCTAAYPCEPKDMNLNVIKSYIKKFPNITIGISDHQSGISMAIVSRMLGAKIFEKHFTLHRSWRGTDQAFSLEPEGFRKMVRDIISVEEALGSEIKEKLEIEESAMYKMRKSIVMKTNKLKDDIINRDDVEFKCPGNGLYVNQLDKIIGKKLNVDKYKSELIRYEDLI